MAKKKVEKVIKLVAPAGKATPAPPLGPVLGQAGVNIGDFVNKFNQATAERAGEQVPVVLSVYSDRSFDFILKSAPASDMLCKAAGVEKGSGRNIQHKVGKVTMAQVREIAGKKMADLNTTDPEAAVETILGTARSMGIEVAG